MTFTGSNNNRMNTHLLSALGHSQNPGTRPRSSRRVGTPAGNRHCLAGTTNPTVVNVIMNAYKARGERLCGDGCCNPAEF